MYEKFNYFTKYLRVVSDGDLATNCTNKLFDIDKMKTHDACM